MRKEVKSCDHHEMVVTPYGIYDRSDLACAKLLFDVEFPRALGLRVEAHAGDRSSFEWGMASLTSSHRREWIALIAFCELVLTMAFRRGLPQLNPSHFLFRKQSASVLSRPQECVRSGESSHLVTQEVTNRRLRRVRVRTRLAAY